MKTRPRINPLVFMGIIGLFTIGTSFGLQLYRAYGTERDIWWTAVTMPLSVEETEDDFRLSIAGKPLREHLAEGSLFALDSEGEEYRVVSEDVKVRVNNWNKVKSSILESAVATGVALGAVITVLVIGLVEVYRKRKRPPDPGGSGRIQSQAGSGPE
jgi:hypothetical protein